ncbi:YesL family protein [Gracilibacillus alcaliphilus]|uniref:YesL family protein n=1 Tax=Gracilibacillus alcaliphilus TaxID=1401441 RepID=UPI00195A27DD|nr:YesL family protein [Gracilibacillus alcaliphilus]MBM7677571.1 putative membrane protein YesL [Gracilibacillus alcaliphilus]
MKKTQGWKNGLVRFAEWFSRLAYLNLLWIGFTLAGLLVFGFFPATAAMFAVIRKWGMGNLSASVFSTFWDYYRRDFVKANGAGCLMAVIGYIMYIDVFVFDFAPTMMMQIVQLILYLIAFLFLLVAVYFFPVYVHFDLQWFQYIKMAVLMAFAAPFRATLMVIIGYGVFFLMAKMPIVMLFFLGSAISYLWLMIALPTFYKLQNGNGKPQQVE